MSKSFYGAVLVLLVAVAGAPAAQISGNYIEARTASVWVGACFANSEVGLVGQEAVMGWRVTSGSWNGTPVAGLSVVGVVRATDTLGAAHRSVTGASSVVIVDERATPEQEKALVGFVRSTAPELFGRVVRVERAPIEFQVAGEAASGNGHNHAAHGPQARLVAGNVARVVTRGIEHDDATCANAELYYQPLTKVNAEPAFAIAHEFKGRGLGSVWSSPNRPSAFVGTFSR